MTVYEQEQAEERTKGRRELLAKQLHRALGKGKKAEALVARLSLCNEALLDRIAVRIVETKKADLVAALERLLPQQGAK